MRRYEIDMESGDSDAGLGHGYGRQLGMGAGCAGTAPPSVPLLIGHMNADKPAPASTRRDTTYVIGPEDVLHIAGLERNGPDRHVDRCAPTARFRCLC